LCDNLRQMRHSRLQAKPAAAAAPLEWHLDRVLLPRVGRLPREVQWSVAVS